MRTDASDIAIAGSLSQKSFCGSERPISFYSKKLTKAQKAWPIIEREAFAVLEGLKRFNHWLFGHSIVCYSDHCPLQYVTESAPKSARLMRWALALQNWSITFKYKAGNSAAMAVPDLYIPTRPWGRRSCCPRVRSHGFSGLISLLCRVDMFCYTVLSVVIVLHILWGHGILRGHVRSNRNWSQWRSRAPYYYYGTMIIHAEWSNSTNDN